MPVLKVSPNRKLTSAAERCSFVLLLVLLLLLLLVVVLVSQTSDSSSVLLLSLSDSTAVLRSFLDCCCCLVLLFVLLRVVLVLLLLALLPITGKLETPKLLSNRQPDEASRAALSASTCLRLSLPLRLIWLVACGML